MFSSNLIKFLVASALCAFSSCGWRAAQTGEAPANSSFAVEQLKTGVPFSTEEPENFQAEFVITANGQESKIFVARAGGNRRYDYNSDGKNRIVVLQTDAPQSFLIMPDAKLYSENSKEESSAGATENFKDFLTNEWLNQKPEAAFTKLGAENNLIKYVVRLDDSVASETIVFVDERINLPVRQEFYALRDGQKILTYAVEMKNFKTQADKNLFEIPKDARKISVEALRAAMREVKIDEQ